MDIKFPSPEELSKTLNEVLKRQGIINDKANTEEVGEKEGPEATTKEAKLHFDLKPIELEAYLKQFVVGQDQAIGTIATKICTHFNRARFERDTKQEKILGNIKSNILLIGPTGVGKTYIVKLIADKLGVPFVKADATKFSETGYVGGDVEDLVRELVHEAKGDISLAEYGIIYLDEIDKIASASNVVGGLDVSRSGVQRNLLKIMEDSDVDLKAQNDVLSQMEAAFEAQRSGKVKRKKINTKNILFIVSGAFAHLEEIIKRRLSHQNIGFGKEKLTNQEMSTTEILRHVTNEDLRNFGFESEFIGRLPVKVVLNHLTEDTYYQILKNPNSAVVLGKKRDFLAYGIKLDFDDDILKIVASEATTDQAGARSLQSIIEQKLMPFEKILPSVGLQKFMVTPEVVANPDKVIPKLLVQRDVRYFQEDFLKQSGLLLAFSDDSIESLASIIEEKEIAVLDYLREEFKNYQYGLQLIGLKELSITAEIISSPQTYIDNLIKSKYTSGQGQKELGS